MKRWKMKPVAKTLCLLGLSAFTQAAYADQSVTQSNIVKENIQFSTASGADNDTETLGTAYHSEKEGFYDVTAVNGVIDETYGNTEMDITVGVDMGYSQLANMLDGKLGAQLDVPAVSVSVGASYAKQNAADNYTGTYTLFAAMKPKKRMLVPSDDSGFQASQGALDIVAANPGNKFEDVGDEFISAIEYGSQVIVNLKFEYKNAEDKVKWGGQLAVDWAGKVKITGELSATNNDIKRDIKITVSAKQLGGDESRILTVIPDEIIKCTMENPQPCFDIFANTITYMKTDYINQFNSLDDYNVVKLFTDKYKTSGPGLNSLVQSGANPQKSILTKLTIKNLTEKWVEGILDSRRASGLLNYYGAQLTSSQRTALEGIKNNALFNASLYAESVQYCKDNPFGDYCRDRELEVSTYVYSYDRNLLEI
jgi:hypothetical protein